MRCHTLKEIVHEDLESLDTAGGKWFKCKYCKNAKDAENKFSCRTPFSAEQVTSKRGHMHNKTHQEQKEHAQTKPKLKTLLAKQVEQGAAKQDAPAEVQPRSWPCQGTGWDITDPDQNWQGLYKAYLYFINGADKASSKFTIEVQDAIYRVKSVGCTGSGLLGWQHRVKCCKPCHLLRTDQDQTAKKALQRVDAILHASSLVARASLSKSDIAFLKHSVMERPNATGNDAFHRFREAVKVRLEFEASTRALPESLKGSAGEGLMKLVVDVYGQGRGGDFENSVVHHMAVNLLQKLAGKPNPQISGKLFAMARVLVRLHKPSYEFFKANTLVGPHVDYIRQYEAKHHKDVQELVVSRTDKGRGSASKRTPHLTPPLAHRDLDGDERSFIYIHIYIYICVNIYIHRERERERERARGREGERERGRDQTCTYISKRYTYIYIYIHIYISLSPCIPR